MKLIDTPPALPELDMSLADRVLHEHDLEGTLEQSGASRNLGRFVAEHYAMTQATLQQYQPAVQRFFDALDERTPVRVTIDDFASSVSGQHGTVTTWCLEYIDSLGGSKPITHKYVIHMPMRTRPHSNIY